MRIESIIQYIKTSVNFMKILSVVCLLVGVAAFGISGAAELRAEGNTILLEMAFKQQAEMRKEIDALRSENATLQYKVTELQAFDADVDEALEDCVGTNIDQDLALGDLEGAIDYIHEGIKPSAWQDPGC